MNRMVAKMLLAVALVGAVTPTYAQGVQRPSVGHSVSFGSEISVLFGVVRSVAFNSFLYVPGVEGPGK